MSVVALACFTAALALMLGSLRVRDADKAWTVFRVGIALNVAGWLAFWVAAS